MTVKKGILILILLVVFASLAFALAACAGQSTIRDIQLVQNPRLVYTVGEEFDLGGAQIRVNFTNGRISIVDVTEQMISLTDFNSSVPSIFIMSVMYHGAVTAFTVSIISSPVESAGLRFADNFRTSYIEGQVFSPAGLLVDVLFKDGSLQTFDASAPNVAVAGVDTNRLGLQTLSVTFTFGEYAEIFSIENKINVREKQLLGIRVGTPQPPSIVYLNQVLGQEVAGQPSYFSLGVLILTFDNGFPEEMPMNSLATGLEISYSTANEGNTDILFSYRFRGTQPARTTRHSVSVVRQDVEAFTIISGINPQTAHLDVPVISGTQLLGTSLNINHLTFSVRYTNQTTRTFMLSSASVNVIVSNQPDVVPPNPNIQNVVVRNFNAGATGRQTIQIAIFSGETELETRLRLEIYVTDKVIEDIQIFRTRDASAPFADIDGNPLCPPMFTHTEYRPFEEWSYIIFYNNNTQSELLPLNSNMLITETGQSPAHLLFDRAGQHRFFIEYLSDDGFYSFPAEGAIAQYIITINALSVESVELYRSVPLVPAPFVRVFVGGAIAQSDVENLTLKLTLANGDVEFLPLTAQMVQPFNSSAVGMATAPIRFNLPQFNITSHNATIPIEIFEKAIGKMSIVAMPNDLSYIQHNPAMPNQNSVFSWQGLRVLVQYQVGGEAHESIVDNFDSLRWTFIIETDCLVEQEQWALRNYVFTSKGERMIHLRYDGFEEPDDERNWLWIARQNEFIVVENDVIGVEFLGLATNQTGNFGEIKRGAHLDLSLFLLRVFYQNGFEIDLPLSSAGMRVEGYSHTVVALGIREMIISYTEGHITHDTDTRITVVEDEIARIEIAKRPDRLTYTVVSPTAPAVRAETAGMIVNIVFESGALRPILFGSGGFDVTTIDVTRPALDVPVTVTYELLDNFGMLVKTFTTVFFVSVVEAEIASISWEIQGYTPEIDIYEGVNFLLINNLGNPVWQTYLLKNPLGGAVYLEDLRLNVVFTDGTEDIWQLSDGALMSRLIVDSFNSGGTAGWRQAVRIYYENIGLGLFVEIGVTLLPRLLIGITVENISRFEVIQGMLIDSYLVGARALLHFSNGQVFSQNITPANVNASLGNPLGYDRLGAHALPALYDNPGITVTFTEGGISRSAVVPLLVLEKRVIGVQMRDYPRQIYVEHEQFSLQDIHGNWGSIAVYFDNGTQQIISFNGAPTGNETNPANSHNYLYISTARFDSREFSGVSRLQRIFVFYRESHPNPRLFQTSFDIVMYDRLNTEVRWQTDRFSYAYGFMDAGSENVPTFEVWGYLNFSVNAGAPTTLLFSNANANTDPRFTIKYIPEDEYFNQNPNPNAYTTVPRNVGRYYIIISYTTSGDGFDRVHNNFVTTAANSKILTITPRRVFIGVEYLGDELDHSVYGQTLNPFTFYIAGTNAAGERLAKNTADAFAFGDNWLNGFITPSAHYPQVFNLPAPWVGTIDFINAVFRFSTVNGRVEDINRLSQAGLYHIVLQGAIESANYDIVFENTTFRMRPRRVVILPDDRSVVYGQYGTDDSIGISYTPIAELNNPNSGLVSGQTLAGLVLPELPDNIFGIYTVGDYLIVQGTLTGAEVTNPLITINNPNYYIIFAPLGDRFLTVTQRPIFVEVQSAQAVFGDFNPATQNSFFEVLYFADADLQIGGDAAFAGNDQNIGLGLLTFVAENAAGQAILQNAGIGRYTITLSIRAFEDPDIFCVFKNYDITIRESHLEITVRHAVITIESYQIEFGDPEPAKFEFTVEGLFSAVGFENDFDEAGGIFRENTSNELGTYPLSAGRIIAANPNYDFDVNNAVLVIVPRQLTLHVEGAFVESGEHGNRVVIARLFNGRVPDFNRTENWQTNPLVLRDKNGVFVPIPRFADVLRIGFLNPSRDSNDYRITAESNFGQFEISFALPHEHFYRIQRIQVGFDDILFGAYRQIDDSGILQDGELVEGDTFVFSPHGFRLVSWLDSDILQYSYNHLGLPLRDDNNNEVKDSIGVILTIVGLPDLHMQNARAYEVQIRPLPSINYVLATGVEAQRKTIVIERKELFVEMINGQLFGSESPLTVNPNDPSNFRVIYNTELIELTQGRNFNIIDANRQIVTDVEAIVRVLANSADKFTNDPISLTAPANVRFENGAPAPYEVFVFDFAGGMSQNYSITLSREYTVTILPRDVNLVIRTEGENVSFRTFNAQSLDGHVIPSSAYFFDDVILTLITEAQTHFTFVRLEGDNRPNSSVGRYVIHVSTSNLNYRLSTDRTYYFDIRPATVSVPINGPALMPTYNFANAEIRESHLSITSAVAGSPRIRNFATWQEYTNMLGTMQNVQTAVLSLTNSIGVMSSSGAVAWWLGRANEALAVADALFDNLKSTNGINYIEKNFNNLEDATTRYAGYNGMLNVLNDGTTNIIAQLNALIAILQNGAMSEAERIDAAGEIRTRLLGLTGLLNGYMDIEAFYIAFIIINRDMPDSGEIINVGTYRVYMRFNDFNRVFTFNNAVAFGGTHAELRITPLRVDLVANRIEGDQFGDVRVENGVVLGHMPITYTINSAIPHATWPSWAEPVKTDFFVQAPTLVRNDGFLNAGEYTINSNPVAQSPNYNVVTNSAARFVVGQRAVTIQISKQIGLGDETDDHGIAYTDKMVYGQGLTPSRIRQWYVPDLSQLVGDDQTNYGGLFNLVFRLQMNGVEVQNLITARLVFGEHRVFVRAAEATAQNYSITVLDGSIHVAKAPLTVETIERIYGSTAFNIVFGGNMPEDDFDVIFASVGGLAGFKLVAVAGDDPVFNASANVGLGFKVEFNMPGGLPIDFLDNYFINIFEFNPDGTPNLTKPLEFRFDVSPAQLSLWVNNRFTFENGAMTTTEASPLLGNALVQNEYVRVTDGNTLNSAANSWLRLNMQGIQDVNNDENRVRAAFNPTLFLMGNTWEASFVNEDNFGEDSFDIFTGVFLNYTVTIEQVRYRLERSNVTVSLNKDLHVLWEPSTNGQNVNVLPYQVEVTAISLFSGVTDYVLVGGQYWHSDFSFSGYRHGDNIQNLLRRRATSGGVAIGDIVTLAEDLLLVHGVAPTASNGAWRFGANQAELTGFSYSDVNRNYNAVSGVFTVYVHSRVTTAQIAEESFLVDTINSIEDIILIINTEMGHEIVGTVQQLASFFSFPPSNAVDLNQILTIHFVQDVTINRGALPTRFIETWEEQLVIDDVPQTHPDGSPIMVPHSREHPVVSDPEFDNMFNDITATSIFDLVLRRFAFGSVNYQGHLVYDAQPYAWGTEISATTTEQISFVATGSDAADVGRFDVINTAFRAVPNFRQSNYFVEFVINGNLAANSLVLVFDQTGTRLESRSGSAVDAYTDVNLGFADIFNGGTHHLTVYYNKMLGEVEIFINNMLVAYAPVPAGYVVNETGSQAAIQLSNARVWVNSFALSKQGYLDEFGTRITPNPTATGVERAVINVNNTTGYLAGINLRSLFNNATHRSGYVYEYLFNGAAVGSPFVVPEVARGTYVATLRVFDNRQGTMILLDERHITVLVTHAATGVIVVGGEDYVSSHNPHTTVSGTPTELRNVGGSNNADSLAITFATQRPTVDTVSHIKLAVSNIVSNAEAYAFNNLSTFVPANINYYAIVLVIEYVEADDMFITWLHVIANGANYYVELSRDINWAHAIHTVELHKDSFAGSGALAGGRFRLFISNDDGLSLTYSICTEFTFANRLSSAFPLGNGLAKPSLTDITVFNNQTRVVLNSGAEMPFTIFNVQWGSGGAQNNNYVVNGEFVPALNGGTLFNGILSLANNQGGIALNATTYASLTFNSQGAQSGAFAFSFAANEILSGYAGQNNVSTVGAGAMLVYENGSLYLVFYSGGTMFKPQLVAEGLNLLNGNEHTIEVFFERTTLYQTVTGANFGGFALPNSGEITYSAVTVRVNGTNYTNVLGSNTPLSLPWHQNVQNWLYSDDTPAPQNGASGATFLTNLTTASVQTVGGVMLNVTGFNVGRQINNK
jgi:hypothetical protein